MELALLQATETPLAAARSAVAAIELCAEAAGMARGAIAADIGGAAGQLFGATRRGAEFQVKLIAPRPMEHAPDQWRRIQIADRTNSDRCMKESQVSV